MEPEAKFKKSLSNRKKENRALSLLLQDPRFQAPNRETRQAIIDQLPVSGSFGVQTFDAVLLPTPGPALNPASVSTHISELTLIEMKATTKPIKNGALNGFFFGATQNEFEMASALKDRYQFAFIVLNNLNEFGRPFFVLLTYEQLERRIRQRRTQFQVNLRTDMLADDIEWPHSGVGPEQLQPPI